MGLAEDIKKQMIKQLTPKLNKLREVAKEELTKAIKTYVYNAYTPKYYDRTEQLLNSVVASEVEIDGDNIKFYVYLDESKMKHKSVVDGKPTFVGDLVNDGHKQSGYTEVDNFHVYEGRQFLERAVEQLQKLMDEAVITMIKNKKYR